MRIVTPHPVGRVPKIERSDENDNRLNSMISMETEDILTSRRGVDRVWIEARRQYAAIPKQPVRMVPVPNAPNIEMPVGAILADDIYAQATDTLFTATPLLIVRSIAGDFWKEHAKVAQVFVNWMAQNEIDLFSAAHTCLLNDTQLGTGVYYIPYTKQTRKDKVYHTLYRAPRIIAMSPEDVLIPPGSRGDLQMDRLVGLRFWYTRGELEEQARAQKWNIDKVSATAQFDLVRLAHEQRAKVRGTPMWREVFEIIQYYVYFDYDGDGIEEDLLVTWDRGSRTLLNVQFNPYDRRPIEIMRYQRRSHLPYGIGVMEAVQPFQEEMTELHCYTLLNIFLANARVFAVSDNAVQQGFEVIPGKTVRLLTDDVTKAFAEMKLSEVYPSALQAQQGAMQMASQRVGAGGAAGFMQKGGSRTPGVTALSLLNQVNRRFAPAFADMRETTAAAVRQCLYRYRERLKADDKKVKQHLARVLGEEGALLMEELLTSDDFDRAVSLEFKAATASVNREQDRQNAIMMANVTNQYYTQVVNLAIQASSQQISEPVRDILVDAAKRGTAMMDVIMRTFDQFRHPDDFLLDTDKLEAGLEDTEGPDKAMIESAVVQSLANEPDGGAGAVEAIEPPDDVDLEGLV
jgi:hypothetical protein